MSPVAIAATPSVSKRRRFRVAVFVRLAERSAMYLARSKEAGTVNTGGG